MPATEPSKIVRLQDDKRKRVTAREETSIEALFDAEESPLLRYAYGIVARREIAEALIDEALGRGIPA